MKFAKVFDIKDGRQVLVYYAPADECERLPNNLEEWVLMIITHNSNNTRIKTEKPMASEEQAEQYVIDFTQAKAERYAETFEI